MFCGFLIVAAIAIGAFLLLRGVGRALDTTDPQRSDMTKWKMRSSHFRGAVYIRLSSAVTIRLTRLSPLISTLRASSNYHPIFFVRCPLLGYMPNQRLTDELRTPSGGRYRLSVIESGAGDSVTHSHASGRRSVCYRDNRI
jgi:hypothetical protein